MVLRGNYPYCHRLYTSSCTGSQKKKSLVRFASLSLASRHAASTVERLPPSRLLCTTSSTPIRSGSPPPLLTNDRGFAPMRLLVDDQAAGSRRIPSSLVERLPLLHLLQEAPPLPHLLHVGEWFTLVAPRERLVGLSCLFSRSIDRLAGPHMPPHGYSSDPPHPSLVCINEQSYTDEDGDNHLMFHVVASKRGDWGE